MTNHILIVDDNDAFREVLSDFFESYEFKVTQASHAIEALEVLENHSFDAIIVDVLMPKMNGLDFAKRILSSAKPTPIAIISGYTDQSNFEEIIKSPYLIGFFPKPFNELKLISEIQSKIQSYKELSI